MKFPLEFVSITIVFFIFFRTFKITELNTPITLLIVVILVGGFWLLLEPQNNIYELCLRFTTYYLAIILTSPILFIKIPTLQLIYNLKNKKYITYHELEKILNKYTITNENSKLIDNKLLYSNDNLTLIGKVVARILRLLTYVI